MESTYIPRHSASLIIYIPGWFIHTTYIYPSAREGGQRVSVCAVVRFARGLHYSAIVQKRRSERTEGAFDSRRVTHLALCAIAQ